MRKLRRWLFGLVASVPLVAYAETAYITEKLEVPVRSGESREYRIIRYLQAGARVEMLQTYESGYTKIRDERGREGFVLGRYLVDRAPSFVIAGRLEAEVAKQRETIKRLEQDIEALTAQNKSSNESIRMTKDRLAEKEVELKEFLATAGDSITLKNRLVALETERQVLLTDNETLRAEKLAARDDSFKSWFALGAITLAVGWFVGLLMPRVRRSRIDTNL